MRRQFDFTDYRFAQRARLQQRRRIHRNARAHHNQIFLLKRAFPMAAGLNGDSLIEQQRNLIAQILRTLRVRDSHPRPLCLQEQRGRHPRLAEADHQHAFVFEFQHPNEVISG